MHRLVAIFDDIQMCRMETASNLRTLAALEGDETYLNLARMIEQAVIEADMRTLRMIERVEGRKDDKR